MCVANAHTMLVSLNLNDTPVGYQPALGAAAFFRLSYSHREVGQPASFNYSNVGAKWSHNFLAYIEDDGTASGANVKRVVGGGGYTLQTGYDNALGLFAREKQSLAQLRRTPVTGAATSYTLSFPDGSAQTFSQLATGTAHRLFLKTITDPQGKSLTLNYDGTNRLTSIVDATSRSTVFSYANSNPLLITKITDPFGRFSTLAYDGSGRLSSITDVLNINSSFVYDTTDTGFIKQLITPYGTSNFASGADVAANSRWLELTDPLGKTERLESKPNAAGIADTPANAPAGLTIATNGFSQNNSFYWDKYVKSQYGSTNYANATLSHWLKNSSGQTSPIIAMVKPANDNPTYFNYPNQPQPYQEGTFASPSAVGKKTDATTAQVSTFTYNALGKPLSVIDPIGRMAQLTYDINGVDVLTTQQKTSASGFSTIGAYANYNAQHLPAQYTDAAGSIWRRSYNLDSQVDKVTDPNGQYTMYYYDANKRLDNIKNTNNVVVRQFHYPCDTSTTGLLNCNMPDWVKDFDGTDTTGYQRSYVYDKLDRVTQVTYPDATTELYSYNFPAGFPNQGCLQCPVSPVINPSLDLWKFTDRQGRVTDYSYDANRRKIAETETVTVAGAPTSRTTKYEYYENGAVKNLIDANGVYTHWDIDIQSRPIKKIYDYCPPAQSNIPNCRTTSLSETYTYDLAGRRKTVTDALGQVKTTNYNADNSTASLTYTHPAGLPDTDNVSFTYDPYWPRMVTMTDKSGLDGATGLPKAATTTLTYTALGTNGALQLQNEVNNGYYNQLTGYYYDALGRLSSRWAAESQEWYGYDSIGRVNQHGTDLGTFGYNYLGQSGLPTSRTVTNGSTTLTTNYGYDTLANDRRLLTIANTSGANNSTNAVRSYAYGYTNVSTAQTDRFNIRSITETVNAVHPLGAQKWLYGYDQSDRLLSATATANSAATPNAGAYGWQYDKLDNATKITYPNWDDFPVYNALNQQTKNAWWANFTYDAAGNTAQETNEVPTVLNKYKWDMEGRLLEVSDATGNYKMSYIYDGFGRRIIQKKNDNGYIEYKRYLWCGQTICQQRATGLASNRRYLAEGEYINAIDASGNNAAVPAKKYVYFKDHLGSVRDLVNADTGARVGALDYTPYGDVRASDGVLPDYQYAGLMAIPEIGLSASATRFYNPGTTRWLNRDWIREGGGANMYAYVGGNPIMGVDTNGTFAVAAVIPIGVGAAIGGAFGYIGGGDWQSVGIGASVGVVAGVAAPIVALAAVGLIGADTAAGTIAGTVAFAATNGLLAGAGQAFLNTRKDRPWNYKICQTAGIAIAASTLSFEALIAGGRMMSVAAPGTEVAGAMFGVNSGIWGWLFDNWPGNSIPIKMTPIPPSAPQRTR